MGSTFKVHLVTLDKKQNLYFLCHTHLIKSKSNIDGKNERKNVHIEHAWVFYNTCMFANIIVMFKSVNQVVNDLLGNKTATCQPSGPTQRRPINWSGPLNCSVGGESPTQFLYMYTQHTFFEGWWKAQSTFSNHIAKSK